MDNESWIIDEGDIVIEKRASGLELSSLDKLIYCFWVADYSMRNAGDLAAGSDVFPAFLADGRLLAADLAMTATLELFMLSDPEFVAEFFDRFDDVCAELRAARMPN